MALAMLAAKSTSPAVFNKDVMTVTEPGSGKTVVTSFAAGKAALAAGKQIQYVGAGGPIVFNQWHNSTGAFEAAKDVNGNPVLVGSVSAAQIAAVSHLPGQEGRRQRARGGGAARNTIVPAIGFGIVTASILAVAGVGFTLQFGVTNILNLAYGDIMTAAAFVAYLVTSAGLSVWLALVTGAAFGSVFSVLLNRFIYPPFVRRGTRLFGMIIVTIAVSLIVQNSLLAIFGASFFSLQMSRPTSVHIAGIERTPVQLAT